MSKIRKCAPPVKKNIYILKNFGNFRELASQEYKLSPQEHTGHRIVIHKLTHRPLFVISTFLD